ncbi:AAA family ATPase [Klebsiella pneumoniae]|nr:AAA family ATPase [Klebsiella pneumoniae]
MIKNIEISNFKIIESLKLSSLKRVNVIAGKNGKGKTSILDSIFITNDIASPDCLIKPIAFRGGSPDLTKEGANKQVISSQADSLIKISRIWADFFPANTSNQPI